MPSPTLQRLAAVIIVVLALIPNVASAYMTAEDVLLNDEFFLPPTARESQGRLERQSAVSAERRMRIQEEEFAAQHPAAPEELPKEETTDSEDETSEESAQTTTDLELLRTLRLLDRITDRQRTLQYGTPQADGTHAGAPLAPTGAGAWLAATTMIGAVAWTIRKAKKSERVTWSI